MLSKFPQETLALNHSFTLYHDFNLIFFNFPIYLQSVEIHSDTFSKWCVGKRGRVEECSVAPLRNKRVITLCGCQGKKGTKICFWRS
jgi:hypothetical protein